MIVHVLGVVLLLAILVSLVAINKIKSTRSAYYGGAAIGVSGISASLLLPFLAGLDNGSPEANYVINACLFAASLGGGLMSGALLMKIDKDKD